MLTDGTDLSERVAAKLRTLIADTGRAPVLVLGTMWPDYWNTLLTRHPEANQPDPHPQARELLAGTRVSVAESFDQTVVDRLKNAPGQDPRLAEAARYARDGQLAQYLAGAPALLERYDTAPPAAKALLTAAMDLRRLGHSPALPEPVLQAVTPAYLTDSEWDDLDDHWFRDALDHAGQRCHGAHRPLTLIRPRPGGPAPNQHQYRLADYLEQTGRHRRHREIVPAGLWPALVTHVADPVDAAGLGWSAAERLLYRHALPLLRRAAEAGDKGAADKVAELEIARGDLNGLRARADAGDSSAADQLAEVLAARGALDELRTRANAGAWYAASKLADVLVARGALDELRTRADTGDLSAGRRLADVLAALSALDELRTRADTGDSSAASKLADVLAARGNLDELRARAKAGDSSAASKLADVLAARGALDELRTRANTGDWYAARRLPEVLAAQGNLEELREEVLRANGAARRILGPALAVQNPDAAKRLQRDGLNLDGTLPI